MDNNMVQKNLDYQRDIDQIAKMLFHAFYFDEEEIISSLAKEDYPLTCGDVYERSIEMGLPGAEVYERTLVAALAEKAEKFFQFFPSIEDAKKTIRFLQAVNPGKAKEIIDEM